VSPRRARVIFGAWQARHAGQAGLFLAMLAFYLLSGSREEAWGDSKAIARVAERYVNDGKLDIGYAWPFGAKPAPDGKFYSPYPALPSLAAYPAARLQKQVKLEYGKPALAFSDPLGAHLASAVFGALTCLLFFRICLRLGVSPAAASATTIVLGLGTMIWPYARDPFSEMLQTACFTGFAGAILAVAESPLRRHALALGAWAGLLVNSKQIYAVALLGAALFLVVFFAWRREWKRLGWTALLGVAAFAPFVWLAVDYNLVRFGTLNDSAVASNAPLFTERVFYGLLGLFASPGKSVFLYSPPLVLALFGLPRLWREHRTVAIALACATVPVVLVYAMHVMWNGDQAWGPRYLVFLHPVALLPLALLFQAGLRRWKKVLVGIVVAAGFFVQILGSALWRGHWIGIARTVNEAWLGHPNASGSVQVPCMACFEHHYGTVWLPPFQAIEGHYWLLRHVIAGDDFATADEDAPWRRYTTLHFDVGGLYDRTRIDWWGLLYMKDHPEYHTAGTIILWSEIVLLAAGAFLWARRVRAT